MFSYYMGSEVLILLSDANMIIYKDYLNKELSEMNYILW